MPRIPLLHPMRQAELHRRLQKSMDQLSQRSAWWTPLGLGMVWGLMPCGFLYTAQLKAAATSNLWWGGASMLAFGLGTLPTMLTMGVLTTWVSADRRTQLFRMGGWLTLTMGLLVLLRTGEMVDYTGHGALLCWILTLVARPLRQVWSFPLQYRRLLGVGACLLSLVHVAHTLNHSFDWQLQALVFMLPLHQVGMWAGLGALSVLSALGPDQS